MFFQKSSHVATEEGFFPYKRVLVNVICTVITTHIMLDLIYYSFHILCSRFLLLDVQPVGSWCNLIKHSWWSMIAVWPYLQVPAPTDGPPSASHCRRSTIACHLSSNPHACDAGPCISWICLDVLSPKIHYTGYFRSHRSLHIDFLHIQPMLGSYSIPWLDGLIDVDSMESRNIGAPAKRSTVFWKHSSVMLPPDEIRRNITKNHGDFEMRKLQTQTCEWHPTLCYS